ncbi:MAG TPA: type II secretion system F family protein [Geobacteraceae bacterium]|nr:type II secretion system F family protein [Geobacteraceae bacterium]
MNLYTCKLGHPDGRITEKEVEAHNPQMLKQSLEEQGFFVFEIRKKPLQFLWDKGYARQKVNNKDLISFNQELLVLTKAGLPIVKSLDGILENAEKGTLAEILQAVREDIKGGAALSDAFERYPKAFPRLYIASIRAGERTGDLPKTIKRYVEFLKRAEGLKKKLLASLLYPMILITVASMAIALLLLYVVPTFTQIYADSGSQLPMATRYLIAVTSFLKSNVLFFIIMVVAGVVLFRRWVSTETGRYWIDNFKLRLPFVGNLVIKYAVVSFTRTFATVVGSGVPIVESLKMSVGTLNNKILERKLLEAITRVEEGSRLSTALESVDLMPPLALRMLAVGESTGSLEEMLVDISEFYEQEVEGRLTFLTTIIEPAIMLSMGLIIGIIVLTMYLPIFKIASTVAQ